MAQPGTLYLVPDYQALLSVVFRRYTKKLNCMGPEDGFIGAGCFLLKTSMALSSSSFITLA